MERPIRRDTRLVAAGKRDVGVAVVRTTQWAAAPDYRRSAVDVIGDAGFAGLSRATTCVGQRNTRQHSAGPVMASAEMHVLECRDQSHLAPGRPGVRQAARASRINSAVARCVRSQAWSSPLHSMCWTGMQGIHTRPTRFP